MATLLLTTFSNSFLFVKIVSFILFFFMKFIHKAQISLCDHWFVGLRPVIWILCHVLARGWRRWLRYFTEAKAESQRPNSRAKTWHKIWMTGLNPNYDTIPIPSLQSSQNKCQNPRSPAPFDSAVTASAHPPNVECTHLLLRSADWWRHNILFSIAFSECKLSTDNYVNY